MDRIACNQCFKLNKRCPACGHNGLYHDYGERSPATCLGCGHGWSLDAEDRAAALYVEQQRAVQSITSELTEANELRQLLQSRGFGRTGSSLKQSVMALVEAYDVQAEALCLVKKRVARQRPSADHDDGDFSDHT